MEPIISLVHRFVIEKYDYCLIPDFSDKESSIAGDLTQIQTAIKRKFYWYNITF